MKVSNLICAITILMSPLLKAEENYVVEKETLENTISGDDRSFFEPKTEADIYALLALDLELQHGLDQELKN